MKLIRDATLYKKDGSSHSPEELDNHQIFGFFFSNTLDNPTEKLLKVLKNFYEILRQNNKDMAIVLVSTEVNANPLRIDRTLEYLYDDWYALAPDTAVARSTILSDEKVAEKISMDADTAAKNSKTMPKKASTRTQTKRRATTDDPVSHDQGDFPVLRKSHVPDFSNMRDLDSLKSKSMIVTRGGEAKLVSKDHNISPSSGKSVLEDRFTPAETALNKNESLKPTDTSMSGATSEGTSLPTFREEKKSTSDYAVGGWKTKSSSVLQPEVDVTDNEERDLTKNS
ncbi:unnamed protein product [Cyprideis torosa]|uniref:Uncharacterized protein n=1 Tax=Cyprideis torosa TaxID=163714 RepID=A0A7R8ZPJ6_9CRUS|nr:unnamed protein product [Cyprideis torosa]CAG0900716.1 unnamed protein product [Cyprideis torosa]